MPLEITAPALTALSVPIRSSAPRGWWRCPNHDPIPDDRWTDTIFINEEFTGENGDVVTGDAVVTQGDPLGQDLF